MNQPKNFIYSSLATDKDLCVLVDMYIKDIPNRVSAMNHAYSISDLESLRREAHRMKGAAGSYGFEELTHAAASLENSIRNPDENDEITTRFEMLTDLCDRIRAGQPE